MKHQMILLSADLRSVYARLSQKYKEQVAEGEAAEETGTISSTGRAADSYPADWRSSRQ